MLTGHQIADTLEPGSPEWLSKISATQAVTIYGLTPSKWDTPHALWVGKQAAATGSPIPRPAETDAQKRGHEPEPLILNHLRALKPKWSILTTGTWQHNLRDWQIASPDAFAWIDGEQVCVEIKSVHPTAVHEWKDGVPERVQAQVQWQMDTTGARQAVVAMSSGYELFDRRPQVDVIRYDEQVAARMREAALRFTQSLELGIPPDADYSTEADRLALRYQHRTVEAAPPVELPDDLAIPYLTALADAKRIEGDKAEWSSKVAAFLGDRKTASWNGHTLGSRKKTDPPTFSAAPKLAERADDILNPKESNAA